MNFQRSLTALVCGCLFATTLIAAEFEQAAWSEPVNGLQDRLVLVEKPRKHGVRWLVPYLELQNVKNRNAEMHVHCDERHLKIELVDKNGNVIKDRMAKERSGSVPNLGEVILPYDSFMRISLECGNWGIETSAAAMVSTDSGAWFIAEDSRGSVFLRATLTGEKDKSLPPWQTWHGEIQTPLIPVDWDANTE